MRILVRGLLIVAGLVLLLLAGLTLFIYLADDDVYRRLARYVVEGALDRKVEVVGSFDFEPSLEPTLTVTDLRIANADWAADADLAQLNRLEVQVDLPELVGGVVLVRHLLLDGLTLDLETGADGQVNWDVFKSGDGGGNLFYPIMEAVTLSDVNITYHDQRSGWTGDLKLDLLSERRQEDGQIETKGSGTLNGHPFKLSGTAGSVEEALAATTPYPLNLEFELPGLTVALEGTADNLPQGEGFDLSLSASSPSVKQLQTVLGLLPALDGQAELTAQLTGGLEALSMQALSFDVSRGAQESIKLTGKVDDLDDAGGLSLQLSGRLGPDTPTFKRLPAPLDSLTSLTYETGISGDRANLKLDQVKIAGDLADGSKLGLAGEMAFDLSRDEPGLRALGLTADVTLPGEKPLAELLDIKLPALGAIEGTAGFALAGDKLSISSATVSAADYGGLQITAKGDLARLTGEPYGIDWQAALDVTLAMADSVPLVRWIDRDMAKRVPWLGPFNASARLLASDSEQKVENLAADLGRKEKLWAKASGGTIAALPLLEEKPIDGLDWALTIGWDSGASLGALIGEKLPELGPGSGHFEVTGPLESLAVAKAQFTTKRGDDLTARAEGKVTKLALLPSLRFDGVAFDLAASSPSTEIVGRLADVELPELGPVQAKAKVAGSDDAVYGLSDLVATAGPPAAPLLQLKGAITNLDDLQGISLSGDFDVPSERLLAEAGWTATGDLGAVQGDFDVSDKDGSLGLEGLNAKLVGTSLATFTAKGLFDDITKGDELKFETDLEVPDPKALGAAFGWQDVDLAAFSFQGELTGSASNIKADGRAKVGQTEFTGKVGGTLTGVRPKLSVLLKSPKLHFVDFGLSPEDDDAGQGTAETKGGGPLFGSAPLPFDWLNAADVDLDIQLEELEGISLDIDRAELTARLQDGRLAVQPLAFDLVKGHLRLDGQLNAQSSPPGFSAKVSIDDLDLGSFLGQVEAEVPVDGDLDALFDVTASGDSARALADSLDGEVSLAVVNGHIRSALFAYTALDLGSWMFAKSTRKGYSELNCFIARFDVKAGVAKSKVLLLDTPNIRALGEGTIDLRSERLRIDVDPQPKSKPIANLTTPFTIKGPLDDPSLKVSTAGAAARTVGEILLTPVNLLGSLLPFVGNDGDKQDNPCLDIKAEK